MATPATMPHTQGTNKGGRPAHADDWNHRQQHIRVAYCRLVLKRSAKWTMQHFGVSRRTVCYWVKSALKYDDPEAQALRELVGRDTP